MATVRKRTWKTGGEAKTAWVADYFDQDGKRHIRTFRTQREAKVWLSKTQHEVSEGIHTPDSTSITVATAARMWLERCTLLVEKGDMERSTRSNTSRTSTISRPPRSAISSSLG
jgi:hypothetical protein